MMMMMDSWCKMIRADLLNVFFALVFTKEKINITKARKIFNRDVEEKLKN